MVLHSHIRRIPDPIYCHNGLPYAKCFASTGTDVVVQIDDQVEEKTRRELTTGGSVNLINPTGGQFIKYVNMYTTI